MWDIDSQARPSVRSLKTIVYYVREKPSSDCVLLLKQLIHSYLTFLVAGYYQDNCLNEPNPLRFLLINTDHWGQKYDQTHDNNKYQSFSTRN